MSRYEHTTEVHFTYSSSGDLDAWALTVVDWARLQKFTEVDWVQVGFLDKLNEQFDTNIITKKVASKLLQLIGKESTELTT